MVYLLLKKVEHNENWRVICFDFNFDVCVFCCTSPQKKLTHQLNSVSGED